jgi:hypothetical protein
MPNDYQFLLCLHLHRKIARFASALRFTVTLFRLRLPLATAAQLSNGRLKQDEVSVRFARVKPDDRTTLRAECETLSSFAYFATLKTFNSVT